MLQQFGENIYLIGILMKIIKSYAANKNLGGGVSLTLSHEIDLMIYLFGKIKRFLI